MSVARIRMLREDDVKIQQVHLDYSVKSISMVYVCFICDSRPTDELDI